MTDMNDTIAEAIAKAMIENNIDPLQEEYEKYIDKLIEDVQSSDLCFLNKMAVVLGLSFIKDGWNDIYKMKIEKKDEVDDEQDDK